MGTDRTGTAVVINWRVHRLEERVAELEKEVNKLVERKTCNHRDRVQTDEGGKLTSVCRGCGGVTEEANNRGMYQHPPRNCN